MMAACWKLQDDLLRPKQLPPLLSFFRLMQSSDRPCWWDVGQRGGLGEHHQAGGLGGGRGRSRHSRCTPVGRPQDRRSSEWTAGTLAAPSERQQLMAGAADPNPDLRAPGVKRLIPPPACIASIYRRSRKCEETPPSFLTYELLQRTSPSFSNPLMKHITLSLLLFFKPQFLDPGTFSRPSGTRKRNFHHQSHGRFTWMSKKTIKT